VVGSGEANPEAFDFAEPALTFDLGDTRFEAVADLPARVHAQERLTNASIR